MLSVHPLLAWVFILEGSSTYFVPTLLSSKF